MRAVVFHGIGDIRVDDVAEPRIEHPQDVIVRITTSAICGTDLHMVRGTLPGMQPGTILGHEGVGVVEEIGDEVRNLSAGERVVIASSIACGYCSYCRAGYTAQCDVANPNGPLAGTAFFGGPKESGPFHGLQAEFARVPFGNFGLVRLPDVVADEQAILLSDIFPTAYFAAELAEIEPGDTVAVFGCGPVGQFCIASARLMDAGRIFAIDRVRSRLDIARHQGAEAIDFSAEDPVDVIRRLTGGIGVDRAIDAVGVDAVRPQRGPAAPDAGESREFEQQVREVAPEQHPDGQYWRPGDAPSQALDWAVQALCKAGSLSIIGVYPQTARFFPIGAAMNKNLTVNMGNCHHRKYIPQLLEYVQAGIIDPSTLLTEIESLPSAIEAYRAFDRREPGWLKVGLTPA
jgi:threonine dehydrogenase-like Zn-dependent dehydrogenase